MAESQYLTPEEAARVLKVRVEAIRTMLRNGTLRGVKLGAKLWRIPVSALDQLEHGRRDSGPLPEGMVTR